MDLVYQGKRSEVCWYLYQPYIVPCKARHTAYGIDELWTVLVVFSSHPNKINPYNAYAEIFAQHNNFLIRTLYGRFLSQIVNKDECLNETLIHLSRFDAVMITIFMRIFMQFMHFSGIIMLVKRVWRFCSLFLFSPYSFVYPILLPFSWVDFEWILPRRQSVLINVANMRTLNMNALYACVRVCVL